MPQDLHKTRRKYKLPIYDDRLPPHSFEAEKAVLGSVILANECFPLLVNKIQHDSFYDLRNKTVFDEMLACFKSHEPIDLITLRKRLRDKNLLEEVDFAYLNALDDDAFPQHCAHYLNIVCEKATLRRQLATFQHAINRIHDFHGDFSDLQFATLSDVGELLQTKTKTIKEVWSVKELMKFDIDNDPNALIGMRNGKVTRFLCRGYGALFVGPSGVGKSSWTMQAAVSFSLGCDVCSIQPVKPLRVLIIQAENDKGDAAEMLQGVLNSFSIAEGLDDETISLLDDRIKLVTERRTIGQSFCDFLREEILAHQADVVFVDPFFSFAGIDVTRQDQCTQFLREQLSPVLHETQCVLIANHHTGKPKDKKFQNKTALEYAYDGIGSSELVNWARAVLVLIQLEGPYFELKLAKRGFRAGAKHPDAADGEPGEFTTSIYLRHASDRIFWEQTVPPETKESERKEPKEPKKTKLQQILNSNLHAIISTIPANGETANSLGERFHAWSIENKMALGPTKCRTDLLYELGSDQIAKLHFNPTSKRWFKGANA